jgi:RNA polymerase sigma factor (sigma-70 family)
MEGRAFIAHQIWVLARNASPELKDDMHAQADLEVQIAAGRCDPSRPFPPFALVYIRGAILDVLYSDERFRALIKAGKKAGRDFLAERSDDLGEEDLDEEDKESSRRKVAELARGLAAAMTAGAAGEPLDPEEDLAEWQCSERARAAMKKGMARLSREQRRLVVGLFAENRTFRAMAAELGLDESTVRKRLPKALHALWETMSEEGVTEAPRVRPDSPWGTLVDEE